MGIKTHLMICCIISNISALLQDLALKIGELV